MTMGRHLGAPLLGCMALVLWASCGDGKAGQGGQATPGATAAPGESPDTAAVADSGERDTLYIGAGCFWCTEAAFAMVPGVRSVTVGYQGGRSTNPDYEEVCSGTSGHIEVARVVYDPVNTRLDQLLDVFWTVHDPTSKDRQGADAGVQYRSVIYFETPAQQAAALASRDRLQAGLEAPIVTLIEAAPPFYPAEDDHQQYFLNNPNAGYCRVVIAPKVKKVEALLEGGGH
jgi:peptide-methionine (S)-S-oxide reductase